jgi:ATP-binding cassette, subfamily B, bacterial PglK
MRVAQNVYKLLNGEERRRAGVILLMMVFAVVLETFSVGLIVPALMLMTQQSSSDKYLALVSHLPDYFQTASQTTLLLWGMAFMVFVYLFKTVYLLLMSWMQTSFAFDAQVRVSRNLLGMYLNAPYTFHLQRNSAQLIYNTTTGVNLFAGAMLHGLIVLTECMVLAALFTMLMLYEPLGTLTLVLILGISGWGVFGQTRRHLSDWGHHYHLHEGLRIQHIQQSLGGVKEVILLGRANSFADRYHAHSKSAARMANYQAVLQNVPRLALEAIAVISLSLLVFIQVWQGKDLPTLITTLGLFSTAAFRLIPSGNRILSSLQSLVYHDAAVGTLVQEFEKTTPQTSPGEISTGKPRKAFSNILLDHVRYRYDGASGLALDDVNIAVPRGHVIGLIGASGSGKSTAVDTFLGLLQPTGGSVLIDGQDIRGDMRGWQEQVGYVPQTIFLTDESLRQNIAFGIPLDEIDDAAVVSALKAAQLYDFVLQLPKGINTEVGERGVRLSGGQRQRIGIARALYRDPPVLVLDEATSALDSETEEDVMQAIQSLRGEKTIILVAHRTSTVAQCDMLYRLEGGKVVAQGSPSEILQSLEN